jgi:hypothetical protein
MNQDLFSSGSSIPEEGERTPKRKNDIKYILFPQAEEYLEPVKFEQTGKSIHVLSQERFNFTNKKEELSIETIDIDTIISLQRAVTKKNIEIVFLSIVFAFVTLGLLAVTMKNNDSTVEDTSNAFHLFETTFEWNDQCLRVISYAYIEATCEEGSYLDEISSWYE